MAARRRSIPALVLVAVLTAGLPARAALDPSFDGDGREETNFTDGSDAAADLAIQADGKVVVVGRAAGLGGRFALARYGTDGSPDPAFGGGDGKVTTNFTANDDEAYGVALQPDGKIVVAGVVRSMGEEGIVRGRFALARYLSDGTLDDTFGGDGKVTTNLTHGEDIAEDVAIQAGAILAVGTANSGCSCARFALVRYDDDGSLDQTFAGDGKRTTGFPSGGQAHAVAVRANGKIVAAGGDPNVSSFLVARYLEGGALDDTFGGDGKAVAHLGRGEESATGVAIQANGKIVAAGYTDTPHEFGDRFGPGRFGLIRFDVDGTRDATFGGDGVVTTRFSRHRSAALDVAIQATGRIVAVGRVGGTTGQGGRFGLVRYATDGSRDATFGGDGRVLTNFTPGDDAAAAVGIQADGSIVAAGRAGGAGGRFAVCRHLP